MTAMTMIARVTFCAVVLIGAVTIAGCAVLDEPTDDGEQVSTHTSNLGGGFAASCTNIRVTNACDYNSYCNLGAWCKRNDGSVNFGAWWNLDNTIWNNNAILNMGGGGGFSQSCQGISITNLSWLTASCRDVSGGIPFSSSTNLNDCLTNWDGELHWTC